MHRTIFSGGSTPSARAHRRKNRHGSKSCLTGVVRWRKESLRDGSHFKPDDNQVPNADHTKFSCREPVPSFGVFDGHHIHIVEDELHRQQTREKADGVRSHRIPCQDISTAHLRKSSGSLRGMKNTVRELITCHMKSLNVMMGPAIYRGG